jgi:hypothetical protein
MNFLPETGFTVSGRLRKIFANVPLENSKVIIAILKGENPLICTLPADTTGRFKLGGIDLTGDARLIVSGKGEREHLQGWLLMDSLNYLPAKIHENIIQSKLLLNDNPLLKEDIIENTKALMQESEVKKTIRKKYSLSDTIELDEVKILEKRLEYFQSAHVESSRRLYGKPDNEVIVTPEIRSYKDVASLLIGRVAGVWVMRLPQPWEEDSQIRMQGSKSQPSFLLDGVRVGYDVIATLNGSEIDRIDVIKPGAEASIFGMSGANGVISVITRSAGPFTDRPVYHSVNIKFSGYSEPRIFYSPKHSSALESDYKPDLRTTLFWKPNIKMESNQDLNLNYFNADNSSTIKVTVEGITSTGIPLAASKEYIVR